MRTRRWLLALGGWGALGLFSASQYYLNDLSRGREVNWHTPIVPSLTRWYLWAGLTWLILGALRRFPLDRGRWRRGLLAHLPLSVAVAFAHVFVFVLIVWLLNDRAPAFGSLLRLNVAVNVHTNLLTYWGIAGIVLARDFYRKYRERELRSAQLETELARSQWAALRAQLHPHFLFNTLNAISALVERAPEQAERMIARLSDLLRATLETSDAQVPLRRELEFVERYLAIERVRFGERLRVEMDVSPRALEAEVPHLILQPLVENAVNHGVARRAAAGRIWIRARREAGRLVLGVRDDGPGVPDVGAIEEGIGLASTRRRLEQLYGPDARLDLHSERGFDVVLTLPCAAGALGGARP